VGGRQPLATPGYAIGVADHDPVEALFFGDIATPARQHIFSATLTSICSPPSWPWESLMALK